MRNKKSGYLSEVAFALYKADYEQMLAAAALASIQDRGFSREFLSRTPRVSEGVDKKGVPVVVMHWHEVNWYSFRPEVKFITQWVAQYARAYKFLRIGYFGESDVEEADTFGDYDSFFRVRKTLKIELDRELRAKETWYQPKRPDWAQKKKLVAGP